MGSMTNEERLISIIAELSENLLDLTKRIEVLEKSMSYQGVYMEGTPEYVREYLSKKEGS